MTELFQSIASLKGIGKKRVGLYERLGITTPYALLHHFPRTYQDFSRQYLLTECKDGDTVAVAVTITQKLRPVNTRRGYTLYKLIGEDDQGFPLLILIFNNVYAYQGLQTGYRYVLYGKISTTLDGVQMASPQILSGNEESQLQPVYPLTTGLSNMMVKTNIRECLELVDKAPFETLPLSLRKEYGLLPLQQAYHRIHCPQSLAEIESAQRRLAFEELLRILIGLELFRKKKEETSDYPIPPRELSSFIQGLPFEPTKGQQLAIEEIRRDMASGRSMNRLLQGDVGSGKTLVAAATCYLVAQAGYQSAVMAPTEILATQHYQTFQDFLAPHGIRVVLLTGKLRAKERREVLTQIEEGKACVIVGTHALMQKAVQYANLGLVITDEQHRFGVAQRSRLAEKGGCPHKLVMSATPIPRTLALMIYGDLDVSLLVERPKGRRAVITYAVTGKKREGAIGFLIGELKKGRQGYIVCSAIEDNEDNELKAVRSYADRLAKTQLQDWHVGILHGQMPTEEKEQTMELFRSGKIHVLISTTVVEVGVDVPNASVMIIEDAERFGLSQLHQLRGRVGRGSEQSYCILITDHVNEENSQRLMALTKTDDGFAVAEMDLALRGPGDFFGDMQHGLPNMRFADLTNAKMLEEVKTASEKILCEDPSLELDTNHVLRSEIEKLFAKGAENSLN